MRRLIIVTSVLVTALGLGACKTEEPTASQTPGPTPGQTLATATAAASLCDLIIEINTSAGYMVGKTYNQSLTAAQLEKIVNLVLLREDELVAAANAAGLGGDYHVVLSFYHALAAAAATNPDIYADYLAGKHEAIQQIASSVDVVAFTAKQKALAEYQRTTCGITFP